MKKKITYLFLLLLGMACHKKEQVTQHDDYVLVNDTLYLPEGSNIKNKIQLHNVKEEPFRLEIHTTGSVRAIPNAYAEITPPFSGRITKSHVRLGQQVQIGSPIFEMSSPDYFDAQKEYFDAKQEFKQAELNLKRQQDLSKYGVGVQRELEETETDFEMKKLALSNAAAALKIFNTQPETVQLGDVLVVRSPIKGEIVDNKIVLGQYLKEDSEPMAIVAELSKVWIAGQIKEKDIRFIHELDEVEIKIGAFPKKVIKGKVYHVKELVDEATRSIEVLIACDNTDRDLRPGMFVTVKFIDAPETTILIPEKAVLQLNDTVFVFVQTKKDHYIKRKIETGGSHNGKIIVTSGLKNDDIIIGEGGIYLLEAK